MANNKTNALTRDSKAGRFNNYRELIKVVFSLVFVLVFCFPQNLLAQDEVSPGEFIVEPPTLTNLGFEWYIKGDDNCNAVVEVEYRVFGDSEWKKALPLLRIGDERVIRETEYLDYTTPHMKYS
jgi:hypothetical protein